MEKIKRSAIEIFLGWMLAILGVGLSCWSILFWIEGAKFNSMYSLAAALFFWGAAFDPFNIFRLIVLGRVDLIGEKTRLGLAGKLFLGVAAGVGVISGGCQYLATGVLP